ncbi:MAG: Rne/Rng family ribonuclease [Alphaproteobacteria bacterium]|nr:Rne/Rng family ribonuclease [Alphaproteobacteria bacterium]
MPKKMLIDASHPEETRMVVVDGSRIDDFDFESLSKKPLKGNIYLAKVTRVEPSLQAAFVEYGGNRHGFLAFSEIHPDYYQIPVADRQALIEARRAEERSASDDEDDDEADNRGTPSATSEAEASVPDDDDDAAPAEAFPDVAAMPAEADAFLSAVEDVAAAEDDDEDSEPANVSEVATGNEEVESLGGEAGSDDEEDDDEDEDEDEDDQDGDEDVEALASAEPTADAPAETARDGGSRGRQRRDGRGKGSRSRPRSPARNVRAYKIQEVIKRRQILLVQVVKEERGTKGAALTSYLSLAGRYCVLMPNTPRGGGISRKITAQNDRRRLKDIAGALDVPDGMGVIVRTAGASRTTQEISRDYEYLLRLWETVRETTLNSTAPALIYEEGNLIKRAIRDHVTKDTDEIVVEGAEAFAEATEFMGMLMPEASLPVRAHKGRTPLFQSHGVEAALDAMFSPKVQLRSGGYVVINVTEALVAIDVNSGKATREHSIEETALKTNLEAAEEIARQLRLRDMAGLIVIDFIDMDETRNNRAVEKRLKDCLRHDRARIQVGRISLFGLLEMSRQRLRAGVLEGSSVPCPHCQGSGMIRSVESMALRILRAIEESGAKNRSRAITVRAMPDVIAYLLNQKRHELAETEMRTELSVYAQADASLGTSEFAIDAGVPATMRARRAETGAIGPQTGLDSLIETPFGEVIEATATIADDEDAAEVMAGSAAADENGDAERPSRRRRRRRRRSSSEGAAEAASDDAANDSDEGAESEAVAAATPEAGEDDSERRRRRRGRRGGRRHRRDDHDTASAGDPFPPAADAAGEDPFPMPFDKERDESAPLTNGAGGHPSAAEEPAPAASPREAEDDVAPLSVVAAPRPAPSASEPRPEGRSTLAALFGFGARPQPRETVAPPPVAEPTETKAAPEPEPEPVREPEKESLEPPRRGWWQRRG